MTVTAHISLLAQATKDGEPVHPGLSRPCVRDHSLYGTSDCWGPDDLTAREDLGALIAAARAQGWTVTFSVTDTGVFVKKLGLTPWGSDKEDLAASLASALLQATATVADNLVRCPCIELTGAYCSVPCPDGKHLESCTCGGTGWLLKEGEENESD